MGKYYYEFLITKYDGKKHYFKHYEAEGLDEKRIDELESIVMKNPQVDSCKYVGEERVE